MGFVWGSVGKVLAARQGDRASSVDRERLESGADDADGDHVVCSHFFEKSLLRLQRNGSLLRFRPPGGCRPQLGEENGQGAVSCPASHPGHHRDGPRNKEAVPAFLDSDSPVLRIRHAEIVARSSRTSARVFEDEARKLGHIPWLARGTLYPEVIESVSFKGSLIAGTVISYGAARPDLLRARSGGRHPHLHGLGGRGRAVGGVRRHGLNPSGAVRGRPKPHRVGQDGTAHSIKTEGRDRLFEL